MLDNRVQLVDRIGSSSLGQFRVTQRQQGFGQIGEVERLGRDLTADRHRVVPYFSKFDTDEAAN